jgi:hypothetical protein
MVVSSFKTLKRGERAYALQFACQASGKQIETRSALARLPERDPE